MSSAGASASPPDSEAIRRAVQAMVDALFRELHHADPPAALDSSSRLDADLGFDSLARVELVERVERALKVEIPSTALESLDTVADLVRIASAAPRASAAAVARPSRAARGAAPLPLATEPRALASGSGPLTSEPRPVTSEPAAAQTLIDVLTWRAGRQPQATHAIVLAGAGAASERLSYGALLAGAQRVASGLARRGIAPGAAVALMLPTSVEYLHAFFGVLLAGAIPVPLYPPAHRSQLEEHVRRHTEILANCAAGALVVSRQTRIVAHWLRSRVRGLRHVLSLAELTQGTQSPARPHALSRDSVALLQYTSGSTGSPKGVVLTHAHLLANIRAMGTTIHASDEDVFVSWLPLYHDMGLIGAWLASLYFGCLLVLMAPTEFLARPARWLRAIHDYRATLCASPNFGYELATRRTADEELAGLDLSSLRIAFNGAEAVYPETLERFRRRFAPYGFRPEAMTPVYGLAEAGVGVTFPPAGRGPLVDHVDRTSLACDGEARPVSVGAPGAAAFVSCGRPLPGYRLRILDAQQAEVAERVEGNLQFAGPSATGGYYRNDEATARLLCGPWRNTGDRAYLSGGELYITGRAKDIVIRRGRHIHPEQIESAVGEIEGVRRGCVAAFGTREARSGTERLVVAAEVRETDPAHRRALEARIGECVTAVIGEPADEIVLLAPRRILKTSSGKLRRAATRDAYVDGSLTSARRHPALRMLRMASMSMLLSVRRGTDSLGRLLFGLYADSLALAFAIPAAALTMALRDPRRIWQLNHAAARRLLAVLRIPLAVKWEQPPDPRAAHIIVANHSSYSDAIFLGAALAQPHRFVAKAELARTPVLRHYLRALGTLFIERFAPGQSRAETERIREALERGDRVVMFPEGTFTHAVGLRAFHLGAFEAAVAAGVPVVPLALSGTRSVLRDGRWLPRRAPVSIVIGAPLAARADEEPFAAAVRLRDAAREHILGHCGEPDRPPVSAELPTPSPRTLD